MQQKFHKTVAGLIHAGTALSAGAGEHGANLGLVVGSKMLVEADLNELIDATKAYLKGQSDLRALRQTLESRVGEAYAVAHGIRDTLKRSLGRKYSKAWEGTGFRNGSLKVPRSVAALADLLLSFKTYLANHTDLEVPNVATAMIAGNALEGLIAAETPVTVQVGALRDLLATRKKAAKVMHLRIRGVVEELKRVIGPVDGRWEAFGLNQPGLKQAPEKPENVSVVLEGETAASVKWSPAPRAKYHRVWIKIVGVDEEARQVGRPADRDFTIEDLPPNSDVEVAVSAVNPGGESPRSDAVVVRTGPRVMEPDPLLSFESDGATT